MKHNVESALKPAAKIILRNRLFAALPSFERNMLVAQCSEIKLQAGDVVQHLHAAVEYVWFPTSGLISLRSEIAPGTGLEVAMVGNDEMVGIAGIDNVAVSPLSATVQIGGSAMRIGIAEFRSILEVSVELKKLVAIAMESLVLQASQNAVCSHFHLLEARLARLLLQTRRRIARDEFHLTHEFLGHALGVRRVGVTKAATALQLRNLIRYSRGAISIIDVAGLASAACSCYRDEFEWAGSEAAVREKNRLNVYGSVQRQPAR